MVSHRKSKIIILSCTRNCKLSKLVVIYKTTARRGEWEGQQQDASQETCLVHRVSNFREKRFGYGSFYAFIPFLLLKMFY
jgi:hypothetical protein